MRWPIYLMGIIMLVLGGGIVFNPEIIRKIVDFIDGLKWRVYAVGVLRLILGTLLAMSAGSARLKVFVLVFGLLIILGGIVCFAIPFGKVAKILAWYRDRTLRTYRMMGIVVLIVGTALIFAC